MHEKKKKPPLSPKEAQLKAANYCAYQERSQKEVRNKLYEYGLHHDEVEEVLTNLILDGFINEERFARTLAGGKFRMKKWGRNRIKLALKEHDISDYCITKGLAEIDSEEYEQTLIHLIRKADDSSSETNLFKKRDKISKSLIYKGYEPELIWKHVKNLIQE